MPEKELPLGKGRRPELAADSESNGPRRRGASTDGHEWGEGLCCRVTALTPEFSLWGLHVGRDGGRVGARSC